MFKNISDNFFVPLASPNKALYWDCIKLLFDRMGLNFSAERSLLMEELKEYFEKPLSAEIQEETAFSEFSTANPTDRASFVLRTLQNNGWIENEIDKNYIQHVNFTEPAIKIYQTLEELESDKQVEYSSRVLTIYSLVKFAQNNNPDMILERMYEETRQLITELQALNANIKHYIEDLSKHKTVQELMDVLMNDYVENIINKAYHRLMTSDNISKVRPEIISLLSFRSKNSKYINAVTRGLAKRLEIDEEEAEELAKEYLYFIIENFRNMDDILDEIHRKNRNYVNSAINRTKFLMADTEDVKGQLKDILSVLNSTINEHSLDLHSINEIEFLEDLIHIYSSFYPDENSFYQPPAEKNKFKPTELLTENDADLELQEEKIRKILDKIERALSPEKINQYVLEQLGNKQEMKVSELPLDVVEDFVKLIYIQLYGNRKNMTYRIQYPDRDTGPVNINGFSFRDFKIKRK